MTAPKKAAKPAEKKTEAVVEPKVEAPADLGIRVKNVRKTYLRQESTGSVIGAGETKVLANDSWLQNQLRAGLLEKA